MSAKDMATKNKAEDFTNDGGPSGWIAVLTRWMAFFIWTIYLKGLGIMLPSLKQQFATTTALLGWIITLTGTAHGLATPFAGLVGRRFGAGVTVMIAGVMVGFAGVAGALVSSVGQLAVVLLLLAGPGLGISQCLATAAIGNKFTKNLATAVGISKTGSSIAILCFAPLTQLLLDTYGWRGTMLLIGGVSFHLAVCGALMITADKNTRRINDYHVVRQEEIQTEAGSNHHCGSCGKLVLQNVHFKLLGNLRYWAAAVIACCSYASFDMWTIFFVSMAQSKGFSPEDAAIFVTIAGVGNLLSKGTQGFIVDRLISSYWGPMCMTITISSLIFYATPWLNSFWLLALSSFVLFFCHGLNACLQEVLFKKILGADLLVGLYGWLGLIGALVSLCIVFLPGLIYDLSGSYDGAFIFIGVVVSVPLIPLLIMRYKEIV